MDPPGCTTAVIPASPAISTQSGKGKKASEAIEAPSKSNPKLLALAIAGVAGAAIWRRKELRSDAERASKASSNPIAVLSPR